MSSRPVMTWSMTLAGLPRAGAISKPHDYKQNVHEMKGLLKKWALTGNSLKISNQKTKKIQSSYGEQNKKTTRPWRQKLNMNHVAKRKLTEANLKKAIRIKLFELCKTRTKKSSPDLFNFYVISAGQGVVKDNDGATACRCKFKAPWLQTESKKMKALLNNWALTGNSLKFSNQKTKKSSHRMENKTKESQDPGGKKWT